MVKFTELANLGFAICHPYGRSDFTSSAALQIVRSKATTASQFDALLMRQTRFGSDLWL